MQMTECILLKPEAFRLLNPVKRYSNKQYDTEAQRKYNEVDE